jgi:hypothetical protein
VTLDKQYGARCSFTPGGRRMIVELYGPPGAGKTTFASALAARLRHHGYRAELTLSSRPAELAGASDRTGGGKPSYAMLRRLARPTVDLAKMLARRGAFAEGRNATAMLLHILPPTNLISRLRLHQYISRLSHSWRLAAEFPQIALFDQAYVQVIYSLALASRKDDHDSLSRALDYLPRADVLVRLEVPRDVVATRLGGRLSRLGKIERLLEVDVATSVNSIRIIEKLDDLLERRGIVTTRIDSCDWCSLESAINEIEKRIDTRAKLSTQIHA